MKLTLSACLALVLCALGLGVTPGEAAEQHRATRLGNPATRFAPPSNTVEDLRARFRDERLRPDFAEVLRQWGWPGDPADLHRAAETAPVSEVRIPAGTTLPFMSSRENGRPICLRNVLWAGREPIQAFTFDFVSRGERYRCITPKPCSNFFVEHLGPVPKTVALTLDCSAPADLLVGRPVQVCLTVRNTGNTAEEAATLTLSVPDGVSPVSASQGGVVRDGVIRWDRVAVPAAGAVQYCATFTTTGPAELHFASSVSSPVSPRTESTCSSKVVGIPAILLEVIDTEDPIEVGAQVIYEIKVTNQGTATGSNIRLTCTLPPSQEFVSASGATAAAHSGQTVTLDPLPSLAPKAVATWNVVIRATQADDARFGVELRSDQFERPINETEATRQY